MNISRNLSITLIVFSALLWGADEESIKLEQLPDKDTLKANHDTTYQQAYLKSSTPTRLEQFGASTAMSGETLVVGAPHDEGAGAAYVFVQNEGVWRQQAKLTAKFGDTNDLFGRAVAILGDTVVIGARLEDSGSTGVNGNQEDNSIDNSGAAYVFVRNGTEWHQQAYLKASNPNEHDHFGQSLGIYRDVIVVGAPDEDSSATGVNGSQDDNLAGNSGAAYVFHRVDAVWSQVAYLKASNSEADDSFGWAVAISGDTLAVGAKDESSVAVGINGDQSDNSAEGAGAVYLFRRSEDEWIQDAYIKASNSEYRDSFGYSLAISNDTLLVGAPQESSNASGVNGDQNDNSAGSSGAAYVFVNDDSAWSQQAYLKASNSGWDNHFGNSLSVSADILSIGAISEDSSATGVNGDQADDSAEDAGAAYVFKRKATAWSQQAYLKASNTESNDRFGVSVTNANDTVAVGAFYEDSNAAGINGDQSDNSLGWSGAVYVFSNEANQPAVEINAGFNDAWYNPATPGQGFLISVFPDIKQMFLAWFTFDIERPPEDVTALLGEPGHRWLTGQGPYNGDTANLTIFVTEGGIFDAAEPVAETNPAGDGTLTIEFADCTEGLVSYKITSLDISGEIPIQRISLDNVPLCESL